MIDIARDLFDWADRPQTVVDFRHRRERLPRYARLHRFATTTVRLLASVANCHRARLSPSRCRTPPALAATAPSRRGGRDDRRGITSRSASLWQQQSDARARAH